jgi:hypothetical protein
MAIIAKNTGESTQRELIPAGTYVARLYSIVHLGHVTQKYLGEEKQVNLVRFTFELPTELKCFNQDKGMQPCAISKEMTLSLNEKSNLRQFINSWRGKALTEKEAEAFDLEKLLGQPCMLNLIHQASKTNPEKVYERIAAVMPMMKGMTCPPQHNPTMAFTVDEFDRPKFESLPTFLQEMIVGSTEYKQMMSRPVSAPAPAAPTPAQQQEMLYAQHQQQQQPPANPDLQQEFDELPF